LRISQDRLRALVDKIAIVVPDDDLLVREPLLFDRWPKMILEDVAFLFR